MKRLSAFKFILLFVYGIASTLSKAQNIAINTAGNPGNVSAILDLSDASNNTLGMLLPNVDLTNIALAAPVGAPIAGLIVWNTNTPTITVGGFGPGFYYWSGTVWLFLSNNGIASATAIDGLSVSGGAAILGNAVNTINGQLTQNTEIPMNGNYLSFSAAGTSATSLGLGIGLAANNAPLSTLDVNGSIATRITAITLSSGGILSIGNSSHLTLTSAGAGATSTTPWAFTLPMGQPGQYLTIEQVSGYSTIAKGSTNVQLTATAYFGPYATLTLKFDGTYWVELTRNAFVLSFTPVALSGAPPTSYNEKQVFTYSGGPQTFTVPSYVIEVYVKMWGAGGAGGYYGGGASGAYVGGYLAVTPGNTYTIIVGGGGTVSSDSAAGGFGGGGAAGVYDSTGFAFTYGGGGGGRASIQAVRGIDLITAGGGGGGGGASPYYSYATDGGSGGATTGIDGATAGTTGAGGGGATTTSGGIAGTGNTGNGTFGAIGNNWQGGVGGSGINCGGGGGGGYYGGGGGGGGTIDTIGELSTGGGGGGSSYIIGLTSQVNTVGNSLSFCSISTAPNNSDEDYISSGIPVGTGSYSPSCAPGSGNGGPAEVVIYW